MTPGQWNEIFSKEAGLSQKAIRRRVAMEVRALLTEVAPGITLSTNELIEALYPRAVADQSLTGDTARTHLYKIVGKLAHDDLSDCCVKGEVKDKKYMGREVRPWLWFCPEDTEVCKACGQLLPSCGR